MVLNGPASSTLSSACRPRIRASPAGCVTQARRDPDTNRGSWRKERIEQHRQAEAVVRTRLIQHSALTKREDNVLVLAVADGPPWCRSVFSTLTQAQMKEVRQRERGQQKKSNVAFTSATPGCPTALAERGTPFTTGRRRLRRTPRAKWEGFVTARRQPAGPLLPRAARMPSHPASELPSLGH